MKKVAVLVILSLLLMACATAERGRKFDVAQANQIEAGKTTEAQVIAMLGTPYRTKVMANGEKEFLYGHATAHGNMFKGKIETTLDKRLITFGKDGIVKSIEKTGID